MQPTGIQPSQLLMEVVASAKEKIGQNIARSEFSQQLHEQHQLAQHTPFASSAITGSQPETPTQNPLAASQQPVSLQPSLDGTRETKLDAISSKGTTDSARTSASTRNLAVSKWKLAQELTFTDTMALEKVLAQYQLGPSITSAVRDALDGQGQITLQRLNQILGRGSAGANDPIPEGTAPAAEIQALLAAVLQQKEIPALNLQELAIQNKGTYDFGEFRDLMQRFVEHAARVSVKQAKAAKAALPQTSESDAGTVKLAVDNASLSRAQLPNQTQSLAANLIPSFLRDSKGPFDKFDGRMPTVVASAPAANKVTRSEALAVDELVGKDVSSDSVQSAGLSSRAHNPAGLGETQSTAALISEGRQFSQASPEAIVENVPRTSPETSTGRIIDAEAVSMDRPQPIAGFNDGLAWQFDAASGTTPIDKQNVLLSSASALANASISAAAVSQPMRSGPSVTDFILEGNAVAQTISAKSPIPVVEKIAASTTASFNPPNPEAYGNRDSALKKSSSSAQQAAQRPAGIPTTFFFPDELSEASTVFPAESTEDSTKLNTAVTAKDAGETATVSAPPEPVTQRTLFRNVVELMTTTLADIVSTDDPLTEPVKAQISVEIPSTPDLLSKTIASGFTRKDSVTLRSVAAELSEAPIQHYAVAGFQSENRSSSSATPAVPPSNPVTIREFSTMQAEPAEPTLTDAPRDPSSKIALPSTEKQQPTVSADPVESEEASSADAEEMPTLAASGKRPPLTGDVPDPSVRARVPAGFPSDSQASPTTEDFITTDYGKPFPGSNTPAGIAGPEASARHNFVALSGMENTVSLQEAADSAETLIPASSSSGERDSGQATPAIPSRIATPFISEGTATTRMPAPEAVMPEETRAGYQNSVELLAQGTVESDTATRRNAPVSPDAAERTTRHNPLEAGARETTAEMKGEKAVAIAQSSEEPANQGQEQGRRQDNPSAWFRNDVQMVTLAANPSADKATEMFSSFTSSLTAELAERIQELHRENRHELTLELQPEHLGRLRVRIGTEDNQVTTLISTESEHVKELLSRGSSLLRQELASQGLVLDKLQIDVNSQATANDQSFRRHGQGTRRNGPQRQAASISKVFAEPVIQRTQFTNGNTLLSVFV